MLRSFGFTLLLALLLAAGCRRVTTEGDDQTRLQGDWIVTQMLLDGRVEITGTPDGMPDNPRLTFAGDKLTWTYEGRKQEQRSLRIRLEPGQNPKAMDLTALDGDHPGETALGIYALKGEQLLLCFIDRPGNQIRPTSFTAERGTHHALVTCKRLPAAAK